MKSWILVLITNLAPLGTVAHVLAAQSIQVSAPCEVTEDWNFSGSFNGILESGELSSWNSEFRSFTSGKTSPQRGLGEAVALLKVLSMRSEASDPAAATEFAKYWIARVFYQMRLDHLAHLGFSIIVKGHSAEAAPIRQAALQCLGFIKKRFPALRIPTALNRDSVAMSGKNTEAVDLWLRDVISNKRMSQSQLRELVDSAERRSGAGFHYDFARALIASSAKDSRAVVQTLKATPVPRDLSHMLLARSYYALGQYESAAQEFQKVSKNSNELPEVLGELAWTYLMSGQFSRAIGVSHQLRSGCLKRTFVPESLMVSAMAYNELCEYPFALASLELFKMDYGPVYLWLKQPTKAQSEFYKTAVDYLRGRPEIPEKVLSEWIRSSVFQSYQEEINEFIGAPIRWQKLATDSRREAQTMRKGLTLALTTFIKDYRLARVRLAAGEVLSPQFGIAAEACRTSLRHYQRYLKGLSAGRNAFVRFEKGLPELRRARIALINGHFHERNERMLALLEEIAENNQLIATEIYSGASRDLVWKNAHPEQNHLIELRKRTYGQTKDSNWSWGVVRASELEGAELWEDEVGFAQARLRDGCQGAEEERL
ncbi:hypothetical protein WDW86_02490 [Bdellovibrionota bacterium FG-2]